MTLTIGVVDAVAQFMDEVGRLGDAEVIRVAGQARVQVKSIAQARGEAREVIGRTGRVDQLDQLSSALRRWSAHSDAIGELAADLSMRPRVDAYPILADALLAVVAGADLDPRSRAVLLAAWKSARPVRFERRRQDRSG